MTRPTLRHRLEYAAARVLLGAILALPERIAYGLAAGVGRLYFRCSKRRQQSAMHQLRNAFGTSKSEHELMRIARVSTGNVFKVALDMVRMIPAIRRGTVLDHIVNPEEMRIVPKGPVFMVSGHLGSWEVAGMALATLGRECHGIGRRFKNPLLNAWVFGTRERAGLFVHPRRGGIRDLRRAMERGCMGILVVDQNQRLRGVFAPWFGELASCERAAATLALRHGWPIVVGAGIREGPGMRFRLRGSEPIVPVRTDDFAADVVRTVTLVNERLADHILHAPEQYLWIHDRYRTKREADAEEEHDDELETP